MFCGKSCGWLMAEFRPGLRAGGPILLLPNPLYSPFGGEGRGIMMVMKIIALWETLQKLCVENRSKPQSPPDPASIGNQGFQTEPVLEQERTTMRQGLCNQGEVCRTCQFSCYCRTQ